MRHLFGTVTASTTQLVEIASVAAATRLDRSLGHPLDLEDHLDPEGTHVLVALAMLDHHAGGQSCSPFIRCRLLMKGREDEPEVVTHFDVPVELYAELSVPEQIREDEQHQEGTVFQVPLGLIEED